MRIGSSFITGRALLLAAACTVAAACGGKPLAGGATEAEKPPAGDPPIGTTCSEGAACDDGDRCTVGSCEGTPSAACGLIVQEWGTYTSVETSDGHPLGGVHHVDEALPVWVHSRNWNDRNNYFFEELPEEPLQQLETPVLY